MKQYTFIAQGTEGVITFTCQDGWLPDGMKAKLIAQLIDKGMPPEGLLRHGDGDIVPGKGVRVLYPCRRVKKTYYAEDLT